MDDYSMTRPPTGRDGLRRGRRNMLLNPSTFFWFRICFFIIASLLNISLAVLLTRRTAAHSDICWWMFGLETIALSYYSWLELWRGRFYEGRLSLLGLLGSAIATQGVLSNSLDLTTSRVMMLQAGCNLGFIFAIGLRFRSLRAPIPTNKYQPKNQPPMSPLSRLTKQRLDAHVGVSASMEITAEDASPVDAEIAWETESETVSESVSGGSDWNKGCVSRDALSLGLGVLGLVLGASGWIINFSGWIKECLDKDTCSELAPQWWSLSQSLLFFVMYILAVALSRTFEVLAAYSVLVSIPVSIFFRVANAARTDFFYLKNQESSHETWDSMGTVAGSSLLATSGVVLVVSMGSLHFSWKTPAPENTRSFRATLSLVGLLGIVIFGIGLSSVQNDVCDRGDPRCEWYDGLWMEICIEIAIILFGVLSVFGQPGESVRAMFIGLATLPSFSYTINITRFLENWSAETSTTAVNSLWEIRFSATGLILLSIVNYLWILAWGWGRSECTDGHHQSLSPRSEGMTKKLLKTVRSMGSRRWRSELQEEDEGLEMGRINGNAAL